MEHFNKTRKKLQTLGSDVFEGYLLLTSLLSFLKELRENSAAKIAPYESVAKGSCEYITSNYSYVYKRIVTKKFADGTNDRAFTQNTKENTPSKMQCTEALQLIYEQQLIEVSPNITTALQLYLTMPITSCEGERSSSKLAFVKNKFRSTIIEGCLNSLCILSLENDIARKFSYDKAVNVAIKKKKQERKSIL
uniref:HAT C-terminal dimerisation domain-containing protein n=1 Tax=Octopus bimaculoides TaxID=37653 RepID=A0A0L8I3Z2_OCTBM